MKNKLGQEPAYPKCHFCHRESHVKQGHILLCEKHYRFTQMRSSSKRRKLYTPSFDELQRLTESTLIMYRGKVCPECNRNMNWLRRDGQSTVVTLQHNRNGTVSLLCQACNARHSRFPDDLFYERNKTLKRCPKCGVEKSESDYFDVKESQKRWNNKGTYCKNCHRKYQKEYARNYRKKQKETC